MMRKICLILVVLVLCSGCSVKNISKSNNKITVYLPEFNLKNQQLYYYAVGNFGSGNGADSCAVLKKTSDEFSSEITLVVKTQEGVFQLLLGDSEEKPFNHGDLFACDFDNDGIDEIAFLAEISGNGYSIAQVFKVTKNGIVLIEDLNKRNDIFAEFQNGKNLLLYNNKISYENTIDISTEFPDEFFNSKGMYVGNMSVNTLPINSLEIANNTKLVYSRPLKLYNYIGTVECCLIWSQESSSFVVDCLELRDNQSKDNHKT